MCRDHTDERRISMYDFPWYDWIMFFFIYSFFGWIIESTYVSFLKKRFVNRA